jgi:threonine dehydratase
MQVIGVEPSGANAMAMSLAQGRRVTLSRVDAFADGVAVKHVSGADSSSEADSSSSNSSM